MRRTFLSIFTSLQKRRILFPLPPPPPLLFFNRARNRSANSPTLKERRGEERDVNRRVSASERREKAKRRDSTAGKIGRANHRRELGERIGGRGEGERAAGARQFTCCATFPAERETAGATSEYTRRGSIPRELHRGMRGRIRRSGREERRGRGIIQGHSQFICRRGFVRASFFINCWRVGKGMADSGNAFYGN